MLQFCYLQLICVGEYELMQQYASYLIYSMKMVICNSLILCMTNVYQWHFTLCLFGMPQQIKRNGASMYIVLQLNSSEIFIKTISSSVWQTLLTTPQLLNFKPFDNLSTGIPFSDIQQVNKKKQLQKEKIQQVVWNDSLTS